MPDSQGPQDSLTSEASRSKVDFALTPRQKRLRAVTLVILFFIFVMLGISWFHPFFHPVRPLVMTEQQRKALAVQGILILGYYAVVFALSLSLLIIAWLYVREIRLQLLVAQRDIWKDMLARRQEKQSKLNPKQNGANDGH
jgi:hypothetical protein